MGSVCEEQLGRFSRERDRGCARRRGGSVEEGNIAIDLSAIKGADDVQDEKVDSSEGGPRGGEGRRVASEEP